MTDQSFSNDHDLSVLRLAIQVALGVDSDEQKVELERHQVSCSLCQEWLEPILEAIPQLSPAQTAQLTGCLSPDHLALYAMHFFVNLASCDMLEVATLHQFFCFGCAADIAGMQTVAARVLTPEEFEIKIPLGLVAFQVIAPKN